MSPRAFIPALLFLLVCKPEPAQSYGGLVYSAGNARQGGGNSSLKNSSGATSKPTSATTRSLSSNAESSANRAEFRKRFRERKRALSKDLMRLHGEQYRWIVARHLKVPSRHQPYFKCRLYKKRTTLKTRVNKALTLEIQHIDELRDWLESLTKVPKRSVHNDCALFSRYQRSPSRFSRQLATSLKGNDYQWVRVEYLSIRDREAFRCGITERQELLGAAFERMKKQPLKHLHEVATLLRNIPRRKSKNCNRVK